MNIISTLFRQVGNIFSLEGILLICSIIGIVTSFFLIFQYISNYLIYKRNKMKYLIRKGRVSYLRTITNVLMKNKAWAKIIRTIALRIGMISKYTYEKNLEIAVGMIFAGIIISVITIFTVVPSAEIIWYEFVYYMLIALLICVVIFYSFFKIVRNSFISKLPDVYKILNSRYISKGNILKAIDMSLDDFDKVMRREMMKIYNILKKNDMNEIEASFKEIEKTYNTEYLTILLSLIKQAHFKGGNDMIKEQFETITEEILQEIENQNDLTSAGNSYIIMSIFVVPVMKYIEYFNAGAIGPESTEYYLSQEGKGIFLATLIVMLAYIGMMLFMERSA